MKPFSVLRNILITALILLVLPGCEGNNKKVNTIGILLFGDSRQPQVDGFINDMKQAGYDKQKETRYIIRNAKNQRKKLAVMVQDLLAEKPDLLVAAGGLEADIMKKIIGPDGVPVVVLYVNAIVERGLVNNRGQTGWNVTGVDNLNAELSGKRIHLIKDMLPNTRRVLILYYQRITPSRIGVQEATKVADRIGIQIDARAVNSREDIDRVMQSLQPGEVDAMLTVPTAPIDNALKDIILPQIAQLKIPLFVHSKPLAELGAFASYGANFYELGQQSARLAQKILTGVSTKNIPFETPKIFTYTVNKDVKNQLGIVIPEVAKHQINEFITSQR